MTSKVKHLVLAVGLIAPIAAVPAQLRKPVNAPIVFKQCGGAAAHDYQVEHLARFQLDSTLAEAPTDTVGIGSVVQFVVDSAGRVIPESLYLVSDVSPEELEQIRTALPKWRFVPAQVGGRATCQVFLTSLRRRPAARYH